MMHCRQQIYSQTIESMQFPQINKFESLIEKHLRPSFEPQHAFSYEAHPIPKQQFEEILSNIEEINLARSFQFRHLNEQENTMSSSKVKSNVSSDDALSCDRDAQTYHSQRKATKRNTGKSLIFTHQNFNKNKEKSSNEKQIKIYYFNLPTCKVIHYDKYTTMENLINLAVTAYLLDKQLDPTKIPDRNYKNFQLRMLESDGNHTADLNIQPISYSRFIVDNLFEALVLLPKNKMDKTPTKSEAIQFTKILNKNIVSIYLYNELGYQLGSIQINKFDSLQKIFDYIELKDLHQMRNYFLTQNQNDQDGLPKDFEVKNLQSNTIYIKSKRFIDQSEFQMNNNSKVIKRLQFFKQKEPVVQSIMPIGLSEASQYEEFTVIKVNNMGIEQERIIGIDQNKVYNYDKQVREEKKQTSFLSKIFGVNQTTGTKRPYRFISDILELKKIDRGFIITFNDKSIKYYVENSQTKERIFRKLNFLVNLSQQQRKSEKKQ